jgi:chromosome segregation ATPase
MFSGVLLVFAVTSELLFLGYQPAILVALFLSLPALQQILWLVICLVPFCLLTVTLLQHCLLIGQRKTADALEARLRGIRLDVRGLEQGQKDSDEAIQYLERSDPEDRIGALQVQVNGTEHALQLQQQRSQASNLIVRVEQIRQQHEEVKDKLGALVAQRRSLLSQLQSCQDDVERTMAGVEQDNNGDLLEDRFEKISEFIRVTNYRCQEIEQAMPGLFELKEKLNALAMRVTPLDKKETGITGVLKELSSAENHLAAVIERLEKDEGGTLAERIRQLTDTKQVLEERVSSVLAEFSQLETIHKDITGLFAKLNPAQRFGKGFEGVTPISFLASAQ